MTEISATIEIAVADGGTRLMQAGTYRGLFTRFPPKTVSRIQVSFETINQALKQRAEGLRRAAPE